MSRARNSQNTAAEIKMPSGSARDAVLMKTTLKTIGMFIYEDENVCRTRMESSAF